MSPSSSIYIEVTDHCHFRCRCSDPTSEECKPVFERGDCETGSTTQSSYGPTTTTTTESTSETSSGPTTTTSSTEQGECYGNDNMSIHIEFPRLFPRWWNWYCQTGASLHLWKVQWQLQTIPWNKSHMWKRWLHTCQWPKAHLFRQRVMPRNFN